MASYNQLVDIIENANSVDIDRCRALIKQFQNSRGRISTTLNKQIEDLQKKLDKRISEL
jgi:hypothetical protein